MGDTGAFTYKDKDVIVAKTGTIQRIDYRGRWRTYYSGENVILCDWETSKPSTVTAMMIRKHFPVEVGLF